MVNINNSKPPKKNILPPAKTSSVNVYCFIPGFITAVFAGLLVIDVVTTTLILNMGGSKLAAFP